MEYNKQYYKQKLIDLKNQNYEQYRYVRYFDLFIDNIKSETIFDYSTIDWFDFRDEFAHSSEDLIGNCTIEDVSPLESIDKQLGCSMVRVKFFLYIQKNCRDIWEEFDNCELIEDGCSLLISNAIAEGAKTEYHGYYLYMPYICYKRWIYYPKIFSSITPIHLFEQEMAKSPHNMEAIHQKIKDIYSMYLGTPMDDLSGNAIVINNTKDPQSHQKSEQEINLKNTQKDLDDAKQTILSLQQQLHEQLQKYDQLEDSFKGLEYAYEKCTNSEKDLRILLAKKEDDYHRTLDDYRTRLTDNDAMWQQKLTNYKNELVQKNMARERNLSESQHAITKLGMENANLHETIAKMSREIQRLHGIIDKQSSPSPHVEPKPTAKKQSPEPPLSKEPQSSPLFRTDKNTLDVCWKQFTEVITTSPGKGGKQKVLCDLKSAAQSMYFNPRHFGHKELADELNHLQSKFVFKKADIDAASKDKKKKEKS